jgi:PD-(D/E)XK endonuclease
MKPHYQFAISKPLGDSERYDFILDNRPRPKVQLNRIQVKCTECLRAGAYETRATYSVGKGRAVYTKQDCDFIAAHACPPRPLVHNPGNYPSLAAPQTVDYKGDPVR